MAKYSYSELKKAAAAGRRIGNWKNTDVYACSKYDYDASSSYFWVLYDEGNLLVKNGYIYGTIDDRGSIDELKRRDWYNTPRKPSEKVVKTTPATSGYSDQVIADEFFSRIDREINELLAGVGELALSQDFPDLNV